MQKSQYPMYVKLDTVPYILHATLYIKLPQSLVSPPTLAAAPSSSPLIKHSLQAPSRSTFFESSHQTFISSPHQQHLQGLRDGSPGCHRVPT